MRYVLQAMVMLGDVLLVVAIIIVLLFGYNHRETLPVVAVILVAVWIEWRNTGGISNWRPLEIRKFMMNARTYGL